MRIGILTGGGDVPGLNPSIKAVVERVADHGHEVVGIRRGWGGLLEFDIEDPLAADRCTRPLQRADVRTIDRTGGTFLHTSRTNPGRVRTKDMPAFLAGQAQGEEPYDFTPHVLRVLEHLELDALIAIGGDDTLSYARRLHEEGFAVTAIPKTMDNDVYGTDYCIGFSTAVTRSVEFIHQLRTSTGSHERLAVDVEKLASLMMDDKRSNPSNYAMCTISEGATILDGEVHLSGEEDPYGHRKLGGIGQTTGQLLKEITGQDIITQELGYLMRSGRPDSLDLMVATNYAVMAADHTLAGEHGRMMALRGGTYTNVPLMSTGAGVKRVDVDALYDVDAYRAKVRQVEGKPMFLY